MKLIDYLHRERLTAAAFAARIDVSASTITRLLARERVPKLDLLEKVMIATDGEVTPNDFLKIPAEAAR